MNTNEAMRKGQFIRPTGRVVDGPNAITIEKTVLDLITKSSKPKPQPSPMPSLIPLKGGTQADRLARMIGTKASHSLGEFYMKTHTRKGA